MRNVKAKDDDSPVQAGNEKSKETRSVSEKMTIRLLAGRNVRLRFDRANARHRRKREAFTRCIAHYRGDDCR